MRRRKIIGERTPEKDLAFAQKRLQWADEALERYAREIDELNEKIAQEERVRLSIIEDIAKLEAEINGKPA